MNKLLQQQLLEHFGGADKVPESFGKLLIDISESYDHYEKDRKMMERSIELSSKEMIELNTEIKKEKEELKKAHKELKTFFEDINEIVFSIDMVANRLIQTSAACEKIYGFLPADFMSDNELWRKIIHPEDKHIPEQLFQQLREGRPVINEYRIIHKDKSIRWIENKVIPTLDADGRVVRINGVTSDITERKQAEKESEASFSLLEATIDSTADGILVADFNGKIVRFNKKFTELWRIPQQILDQQDDEKAIAFVLDQLTNPEEFLSKVKELYVNHSDVSFDILRFKDGRTFERYSQPQLINGNFVGRVWNFRDITVRKQAEDKLVIASNELQQALGDINKIMDSSMDVICAVNEEGYFMQVSAACETIWGYKADELIGKLMIDFVYPEDREKTQKAAMNVIAGNNMINFENRYIRKDGSLVPINWSARWDAKDRIRYGVARDATEKKRSEKALEIQRQRYNELFLQAPSCIGVVKGPNHVYEMANPLYLQLIGNRDIIGKPVREAIPETVDQGFIELLDEVYKTGKSFSANEMHVKLEEANGNLADVYLNFVCQAYRNNEGNVDGIFFFGIDVTEKVLSRKKAEDSELRYRSLVEQATDAICITDASMKFIDINQYALRMFGYTMEEALQLSWTDVVFAEDLAANPINLNELKSGRTARNERRLKRKDGTSVDMAISTKLMEDGRLIMFAHDISERKKAEAVLKENEGQLSVAAQIAKLGYWEFDVAKNLFKFNDQFYSIFKTTAEQVGGYTMSAQQYASLFLYPDDIEMVAKEAIDSIKSHDVHYNRQIEHRIKYATGGIGYVAARFLIVKNEQGRTIKTYGAIQDITERKKAEEALTNNELRFRTLTSNAPVGIFQTDIDGKTTYVNETWLSFTGMTMDEALGEGWVNAVHPDDRKNLLGSWYDKSQQKLKSASEYRFLSKEGNISWVSGLAIPLFNNVGVVTGHIGTLSDITERKNAEAILTKSERQLSIAAQIAKLGYWEMDIANNLFTFTDQFYTIFKTTAEKVGGYTMTPDRYAELFVYPDDRRIVGEEVSKAIHSSEPLVSYQVEHRIVYATGEIGYIAVHFYVVKDEEGHTIKTFGITQDITERKKGEETLLRSEANLEIKNKQLEQKNKELEQFAYVASHDMQEPLRTTSSFIELLQKQYKGRLDEKADKYLSFIGESSDRMKVLIRDLLDYSRIGRKTELAKVDCKIILKEVLADLGKAIDEANAEIKADDDLPVINGYRTEIKQLFQNLIINAIKFRKQNTTPDINICVQEKDSYWEFAVRDNGIGIEQQHKERIFVIFQRLHTRNEYEGSGIGLAHCKKIVELHGGKIWIESTPGEGTTFHFTIHQNNNL